ncbi:hypothetical protein FDI69_gp001 [Rhodococcus phage Trina]|uniref:Uncharacterized protein n=1 Tax=Rhodococcus phage Trina TaxID=2027905 RepID=A0A2D1A6B9_9CAUD|nr:hypothetical protein FDI69_gp001 [Rhodococcus phage Trina]ASZ74820.1 hypothetical protein SEA_TRINA_1 [Rhodococcus phage Trina]
MFQVSFGGNVLVVRQTETRTGQTMSEQAIRDYCVKHSDFWKGTVVSTFVSDNSHYAVVQFRDVVTAAQWLEAQRDPDDALMRALGFRQLTGDLYGPVISVYEPAKVCVKFAD